MAAALAAVKDSVKVPWQRESSSDKRASRSDQFEKATDEATPTVVPHDPPQIGELTNALTGFVHAQLPLDTTVVLKQSEQLPGPDPVEDSLVVSEENHEPEANRTEVDMFPTSDSAHTSRIILKKHFETAMSEIRPSASEEGSLPELRKVGGPFTNN